MGRRLGWLLFGLLIYSFMLQKILWLTIAGAVASVLTVLFSGLQGFSTLVINWHFSGALFALIVTAALALQDSRRRWDKAKIVRYSSGALILALGPPCGILVFVLIEVAIDRTLGSAPDSSKLAKLFFHNVLPIAGSIMFWALCLTIFLRVVVERWRTTWFVQATVFLWLLFALVIGADSATQVLWQKSVFGPGFILAEQIGSAIFLALAVSTTPSGHTLSKFSV